MLCSTVHRRPRGAAARKPWTRRRNSCGVAFAKRPVGRRRGTTGLRREDDFFERLGRGLPKAGVLERGGSAARHQQQARRAERSIEAVPPRRTAPSARRRIAGPPRLRPGGARTRAAPGEAKDGVDRAPCAKERVHRAGDSGETEKESGREPGVPQGRGRPGNKAARWRERGRRAKRRQGTGEGVVQPGLSLSLGRARPTKGIELVEQGAGHSRKRQP